jgi:patatin-related protein
MADEAGLADAEVVRLALVMNGGVSLAVWMGGVTHEIDRIRRAWVTETESVYAHVLKAVGCVVQVDVIGGASAGGINGAALAGAVAFDRSLAPGRPIMAGDDGASAWMRDLWLELGSFSNLLRPSFPEGPPSLMQGDEYFLTRLASAFGDLTKPGSQAVSPASRTIRYIATVTDVEGEPVERVDDFDARYLDREHRARLSFGFDPTNPWSTRFDDDFAAATIKGDSRDVSAARYEACIHRLALAGRSSASFPFAFEPSWWGQETDVATFSSPRYVVDGGIFDNAPFDVVLDAVSTRRAARVTHRVLAYVTPYTDDSPPLPAAAVKPPAPSLSAVLDLSFNTPRDVGITNALMRLDDERADRGTRPSARDTLLETSATPEGHAQIESLATAMFTRYQRVRLEHIVREILSRQADAGRLAVTESTGDALLSAAIAALAIPESMERALSTPWSAGLTAARRIVEFAIDAVHAALRGLPRSPELADARHRLRDTRSDLAETWHQLQRLGRAVIEAERTATQGLPADATGADLVTTALGTRRTLFERWPTSDFSDGLRELDLGLTPSQRRPVTELVLSAVAGAAAHSGLMRQSIASGLLGPERQAFLSAALATLDADAPETIVRRLLAVEIVQVALGCDDEASEPAYKIVRMTGRAYVAVGAKPGLRTPAHKVTGLRLGHFGGFLKASWRANDWLWGRLDGADHLTRLLLAPDRLRRAPDPDHLVDGLLAAAGVTPGEPEAAELTQAVKAISDDRESAVQAHETVERWRKERILPRLQAAIVEDEMPVIWECAERERKDNAIANQTGAWLDTHATSDSLTRFETLPFVAETLGAVGPRPVLTRPAGRAASIALGALTSPANRFPAGARSLLRPLLDVSGFGYGLSQRPTASALTRFALWTTLLLAAVTLVSLAATVGVWWLLFDLLGTGRGIVVGVCVLVLAAIVGAFSVRSIAEHLLGRRPVGLSGWVVLGVALVCVMLLTGGLAAPVGVAVALFVGRRRRRRWTGTT